MRSKSLPWLFAVLLLAAAAVPALAAPGWLGVGTQPTDEDLRRGLDLTRDGLLVNRVFEGSPAEKAGVRKGDVILRFAGRSVTDPGDLRDAVRETGSGQSAKLEVWRNGAARTLQVRLATVPESERDESGYAAPPAPRAAPAPAPDRSRAPELERLAPPAPPDEPGRDDERVVRRKVIVNGRELPDDEIDRKLRELRIELPDMKELKDLDHMRVWSDGRGPAWAGRDSRGRLGVRVEKLSPELGEALGVPSGKGVVVLEVIEDTPAQAAGLRAGDVIVEVAGRTVEDRDDLVSALEDREGKVDIVLARKGARRTVQAELPDRHEAPKAQTWNMGPGSRTYTFRIPEPGRAPRVYRYQTDRHGDEGDAELREEMRQLKQELRELKEQLGEHEQEQAKEPAKAPEKPKTPAPAKKK